MEETNRTRYAIKLLTIAQPDRAIAMTVSFVLRLESVNTRPNALPFTYET